MTPKVSVIICFYNEVRFLSEAVKSVLQQGFADYELLLAAILKNGTLSTQNKHYSTQEIASLQCTK